MMRSSSNFQPFALLRRRQLRLIALLSQSEPNIIQGGARGGGNNNRASIGFLGSVNLMIILLSL